MEEEEEDDPTQRIEISYNGGPEAATQSVRQPAAAETCGGEVGEVEVGGEDREDRGKVGGDGHVDRGEVGSKVGGLTLALSLFVFVFYLFIFLIFSEFSSWFVLADATSDSTGNKNRLCSKTCGDKILEEKIMRQKRSETS